MSETDIIAFSTQQQAAVLGHALRRPELWTRLDLLGITKEWFLDDDIAGAFDIAKDHRVRLGKPPGHKELVEHWVTRLGEDAREPAERAVKTCLTQAAQLTFDVLDVKLLEWAGSRIVAATLTQAAKKYNAGEHAEARRLSHAGSAELRKLEHLRGDKDCFVTAGKRGRGVQAMIDRRAERKLQFGIPFFDDALRGIFLNDVILVGARSGAGKTELARIIAESNARAGARVAFFALEAFENEIEARIMFAHMSQAYYDEHPEDPDYGILDYGDWVDGDKAIKTILSPYLGRAEQDLDENLTGLHTYYRARDHFGTDDFEREASSIGEKVDLIVLDHIHYVDLDGKDENRELTQLMKTVSDVSRRLGVPFIIVAHLRKSQGGMKAQALVPDMDEYHGASGLSKIATGAVMLARAPDSEIRAIEMEGNGDGATFQRIVKSRTHGGAAMKHVAIAYFDRRGSRYGNSYALGQLAFAGTSWRPMQPSKKPKWVKHSLIEIANEIK